MSNPIASPPSIHRLVLTGFVIGGIRYTLEFLAPGQSMYFGLYYVMPVALLAIGLSNAWGSVRWLSLLRAMVLTALIVWGTWNSISYTTAQFLEWNHGRFSALEEDQRALPIAATAVGKIGLGVLQGLLTSIAGAIWLTAIGTLTIWLPGRLRNRHSA